jgi:hypothetical protein
VASAGKSDTFSRWRVRSLRCYEEGLALRGVELSPAVHPLASDPGRAVLFEFLAAAVCHATNWDRLRSHLVSVALEGDFDASSLSKLTGAQFEHLIGPAFGSAKDAVQRHELFTSVAAALASPRSPLAYRALRARPQQLAGPSGLYELLDALPTFQSDPQRKKTRILVQQLYRYRLVHFVDPEHVRLATEYHLIRLYLRTERVEHAEGLEFAAESSRASDVRSVTALRLAVEEAMHYTAAAAGMALPDLNEIEWQIARSFCVRD